MAECGVDYPHGPALSFKVVAKHPNGRARASELTLPHFTAHTPMFMPVGTQGTVKGLTTQQLERLDCHVILGNTYHLSQRPTGNILEQMGGLHSFMNWNRGMLTDSGGFQMVSLLQLANITEEGVNFQSPHDGTQMLLTPEKSMEVQNQIGADIMMALDDVVSSTTTGPRVEEAMHRTIRWIDRCIAAHKRPQQQNLFGIVQGGLDPGLRDQCLDMMIERDLPGYAIGGLSGGESKDLFWRVVSQCAKRLPEDKPRYLMGVGYAVDLVVCSALGVDMFDCVYPTRTARFGTALVPSGTLNLKKIECSKDFRPIDEDCGCDVCLKYTRSALHCLCLAKDESGLQLVSYHNIAYQMRLMRQVREAIKSNAFDEFVSKFLREQFPKGDVPGWVKDALTDAEINVNYDWGA